MKSAIRDGIRDGLKSAKVTSVAFLKAMGFALLVLHVADWLGHSPESATFALAFIALYRAYQVPVPHAAD
jgi:Flp pilus assembly protein TadB